MADLSDYPEELREILEIVEEVDISERNEMLIDYSDRFSEVPEHIAKRPFPEENRVQRCESEAYVFAEPTDNNRLNLYFAVENPQGVSARALSAILQETLSGKPIDDILSVPSDLVTRLFGRNISMGKGEGLLGIVSLIKYFAKQHVKS
jgi:sulfur transfer protein SufE